MLGKYKMHGNAVLIAGSFEMHALSYLIYYNVNSIPPELFLKSIQSLFSPCLKK